MKELLGILKLLFLGVFSIFSVDYGKTKQSNKQLKARVKDNARLNKIRKKNSSLSYDELCSRLYDPD